MLKLWWIAVLVIVSDQVTKYLAVKQLTGHPGIDLLPFLRFELTYNTGAAFGFLSNAGGWQNLFFVVVALLVSVFIILMVRQLGRKDIQVAVALLLILGGALGNVIDRVRFSHVVDFIDVYYRHWHWPTFNVADSAIVVGAALLIMDAFGLRLGKPHD